MFRFCPGSGGVRSAVLCGDGSFLHAPLLSVLPDQQRGEEGHSAVRSAPRPLSHPNGFHFTFFLFSLNRTLTSRRAEQLTSESSDSDNEEDSLFGPPSSKNSRRGQRRPSDPWAASDSLVDSCSSRGSEKELQAFLSMRDEADQATEVTPALFCLSDVLKPVSGVTSTLTEQESEQKR